MEAIEIRIKEDVSIDWLRDYGVNALSVSSHIFIPANDFCGDDGVVIVLDSNYNSPNESDVDEFAMSDLVRDLINGYYMGDSETVEMLLYTKNNHYLCGYVSYIYE